MAPGVRPGDSNTSGSPIPPTNSSAQPTSGQHTAAQPTPLRGIAAPSTQITNLGGGAAASCSPDIGEGQLQGSQGRSSGGSTGVQSATNGVGSQVSATESKDTQAPALPVLADVLSRVLHCCYSEAWQTRLSGATALKMLIPKCEIIPSPPCWLPALPPESALHITHILHRL